MTVAHICITQDKTQ